MELYDVMRTTGAVRRFTDDPLPDEVLERQETREMVNATMSQLPAWRWLNCCPRPGRQ